VQLGIEYLHQGDVALAKDKLDRALAEAPNSADVHSARAMLFARMHDPDKADAEFRTSLRLGAARPDVVNNYAVYCARTVAPMRVCAASRRRRITRCIAPPSGLHQRRSVFARREARR